MLTFVIFLLALLLLPLSVHAFSRQRAERDQPNKKIQPIGG
jgi:hypothetical protein